MPTKSVVSAKVVPVKQLNQADRYGPLPPLRFLGLGVTASQYGAKA